MDWWLIGAYVLGGGALVMAVVAWLSGRDRNSTSGGLHTWFVVSWSVATVVTIAAIALFLAGLHWEWVADRYAIALAPLITVVTAGIGSAGAARHAIAQAEAAKEARLEDSSKEMWQRFEGAAKQLADDTHFAIRVAGVHSLAGLADDWVRHHNQLGTVDEYARKAECETIVDTLCGYLRMNAHLKQTDGKRWIDTQAALVNEAILVQLRLHLRRDDREDVEQGMWTALNLELDLHGTDLSKWIAKDANLNNAKLNDADLYDADLRNTDLTGADLRKADLCAADLTGAKLDGGTHLEGVKYDDKTKWPADIPVPSDAEWQPVGGKHERMGYIAPTADQPSSGQLPPPTP